MLLVLLVVWAAPGVVIGMASSSAAASTTVTTGHSNALPPASSSGSGDATTPTSAAPSSAPQSVAVAPANAAATSPAASNAAAAVPSELMSGQELTAGHLLVSPNRQYSLTMKRGGPLDLTAGAPSSQSLWAVGSAPGSFVAMQSDCNLVIYAGSRPTWASGTNGHGSGCFLASQSDGNLVIYNAADRALWATGTHEEILRSDQLLEPNQWLSSPNGQYRLVMEPGGNAMLSAGATAPSTIWSAPTGGNPPGSFLALQSDCNLVVYAGTRATWASGTNGHGPGCYLAMQSDGNLVIYDAAHQAVWGSGSHEETLLANQILGSGQWLSSPNGQYTLTMGPAGNLVLSAGVSSPSTIWSAPKNNFVPGSYVAMQSDCNLVIYAGSRPTWASGTSGHGPGCFLAQQSDGNLVLYNADDQPLWAANSHQQVLQTGQRLDSNQWLSNGPSMLIMQGAGNAVLYKSGKATWGAPSRGSVPGSYLVMQGDCNLVIYAGTRPTWASGSGGAGSGCTLVLQPGGTAFIRNNAGKVVWRSLSLSSGGSSIVALAAANVGKGACSTNSLHNGVGFESSCTGNGGAPEFWCADFAKWVWANSGVLDTGILNAESASFWLYGQDNRTLSNVPQVGDAVVYDYSDGYAQHVAIVSQVNPNGTIESISGDWGGDSGSESRFASTSSAVVNTPPYPSAVGSSSSVTGMTISGYVAPVIRT